MSATGAPRRLFLSYRRDDSQGFAGRIYDRLAVRFGPQAVFRDINDMSQAGPGPRRSTMRSPPATCSCSLSVGRGERDRR